jgi:iron complex transport system ATP-binding protein
MGINGCGKSTLIDCVLGANKPCAGTIEVFGQDAAHLPQHKLAQYVSYVPQVHEKTFPYTVAHIVEMGATARSRGFAGPDDSAKEQALAALERCGIADLAERPYTTLSGGQMQMALLARALVQASPIILMDEPTAHLDFANELVFLETLTELAAERGMSILMATHSPNHAFHLARSGVSTRVALMSGGKIVEVGAPRTTLTPQNLERIYGIRACVLEGWELTDLDAQGGEGAEGTAGADGGEACTTFAASDAASDAPATTDAASGARSILYEDRSRPIIRQIVPLSTIKEKR